MKEKNLGISISTMFKYNGYSCICAKDTVNVFPNETPTVTLKIYPNTNARLLFSYVPKEGLDMTGATGGVRDRNILGKLLSIPHDNIDKHIEFIQTYGFLYALPENEYTAIDASALVEIVNRIKAVVRLYSCVNKKDYRGILVNAIYLLFSPANEIQIKDTVFSTCVHIFNKLLTSYSIFPDLSREPEVVTQGTYSMDDSFLNQKNTVDIEFYNSVRSGEETNLQGSRDPFFKHLLAMYTGCKDVDEDTRFLIDFFYHFQTEFSIIKEVHFGSVKTYTKFTEDLLPDYFRAALLQVARIVIAAEINHNIKGIHPKYDGGKLTAIWEIGNLIEALYFSIFYMKNGQMYKECENPNCKRDKYFLVEATRNNKRYCCDQCRNAAGAQRYRNRNL